MCPFSSFYAISSAHPDRKSFRRLLTAHTSLHSRRTFCLPRRLKRRNPRSSLICPKTGSTTALRILHSAPSCGSQLPAHRLFRRRVSGQRFAEPRLGAAVLVTVR